nr:ornithine racemase Orr [Tissierella sp.]
MQYPRLIINTDVIRNNTKLIVDKCSQNGIAVVGVTKGVCAQKEIVESFIKGGVKFLGDSRIENLISLAKYDIPKMMLRLPMISEADKIVKYTDLSLNSEIDTIRALDKAALRAGKIHGIILMIDLGDLREGYYYEKNLLRTVELVCQMENVKVTGLGTNLTCFGAVIPEDSSMITLERLSREINDKLNLDIEIISGGNSSTLHLLEKGKIKGINNLRLGESLLLGKETAYNTQINGTSSAGFILEAEIIERKSKPSMPVGKIGLDAFGDVPVFIDKGLRTKLICAIGKQDVKVESLIAMDKDLKILGASSDHLIIDSTDSSLEYKVGDIVSFHLGYSGILSSMTSKYIKKIII